MFKHLLLTFPAAIFFTLSNAVAAPSPNLVYDNPFITKASSDSPVETTVNLTPEQMFARLQQAKGRSVKLDSKGEIVESNLTQSGLKWDCIHHKNNGLTWEIKTNSGLRDKSNTYTWVENTSDESTLISWFENMQGKCTGDARCETSDYIATINQQRLCNFSDWRLPTRAELGGLVSMSNAKNDAKIDIGLFPNTLPSWYWTADINENNPEFAWYVLFRNGVALSDKKHNPKHIRLVRGNL